MLRREKGAVAMLCEEIGYPFDKRLERWDVLVAFVGELVAEIDQEHYLQGRLADVGAPPPTEASTEALHLMRTALSARDPVRLRNLAAAVHDAADRLGPPEDGPANHVLDMLESCASALRFGLETHCHSRHAAHAAQHVWKQLYGLRRFDRHSGEWEKSWARAKLQSALVSMLRPAPEDGSQPSQPPDGEGERLSSRKPTDSQFTSAPKPGG